MYPLLILLPIGIYVPMCSVHEVPWQSLAKLALLTFQWEPIFSSGYMHVTCPCMYIHAHTCVYSLG